MRAIHTIALLPVITVLCWGQEEGAQKRIWRSGLAACRRYPEAARRASTQDRARGYRSITGGDSSMATSLPCTAKSTFWPVRFAKFLRASRQLLKTSPVSMSRPVCG